MQKGGNPEDAYGLQKRFAWHQLKRANEGLKLSVFFSPIFQKSLLVSNENNPRVGIDELFMKNAPELLIREIR